MASTATLKSIYRFPVKGLSPEPLPHTALSPGQTVPGDRLYAIENGPSGFDPAAPKHQPKMRYLMLMRNERLATLRTRFDDASHTLIVDYDGREQARGDLRTADGRTAIEGFFATFSAADLRGPPKVLNAPGFSFSDVAAKVVSIINLASVADLENYVGAPIDPLRFRANLYVTGWPAWQELDMVGRRLSIGNGVEVKIVKRIVRCAATNVDPVTGARDMEIPATLLKSFGHADCGIYGEVVTPGTIAVGDTLRG
ncbi:MAG TPA: MOSC domain-containing protein [Xanthobacteraceae bacterium]|nr:MOSC domain-containing protein [Xanthobacteraceae bacterium]